MRMRSPSFRQITTDFGRIGACFYLFITKLYDKREAFTFDIVSLPDLRGNITEASAYGVIKGQVIRYARNCSLVTDLCSRIFSLSNKVKTKGYEMERIWDAIKTCITRCPWIPVKYDMEIDALLKRIRIP